MQTESQCSCSRSNQGRAICPTPERCDALLTGIEADPQLHSDTRLHTARTVEELFGRRHMSPTEWAQPGIPWLAKSVVCAGLLLGLLLVAIASL